MSIRIEKYAVHLPAEGLVILDTMLVLRDPDKMLPERNASLCWLVLEDPEGKLCWELGEWQDGTGIFSRGWYLMGMDTPIKDCDYKLRYWCYEPPLPNLASAPA